MELLGVRDLHLSLLLMHQHPEWLPQRSHHIFTPAADLGDAEKTYAAPPFRDFPGRYLPLASTQSPGHTCLQGRMGNVMRVLDG